jgi:hypothetical protein
VLGWLTSQQIQAGNPMSRKAQRVPYRLDDHDIPALTHQELKTILRGADDLIMRGGRTLLAKILKGSRDKRVLVRDLDQSPAYGYYQALAEADILARIDWVIERGFLRIEYDGRLPLLVYTADGWEIEKETYANELLHGFDTMLASSGGAWDMSYLKDRDRGLINLLLDKVEATGDRKYVPLLEAWSQIDYHKVQQRIREVIRHL